jgi:tetratricopeptide (TPR) repeat protein
MNSKRHNLARIAATTLTAAVLMATGNFARADIIHLKDGSTLTGDIKKTPDGWTVIDEKGKSHVFPVDAVRTIELSRAGSGPESKLVAMDRLMSIRRSVENLTDVKSVIDRFEKFIEQNKENKPVANEAQKDLAIWKERLERGMVKVGNRWVGPEEKARLQEEALGVVAEARELVKQNKMRDAQATLEKALAVDPTNGSALYLKGLILYRQDKINDARKAFEAVVATMPDHGPTLNNLAIVLWRQNQRMPALSAYDQAMVAMPLNKELLNNVAEALAALNEKEQNSPIAQKVYRRWTEQDTQLQQQMAPLGWYRWGATWVTKDQYDKLKDAEQKVKDQIVEMEKQFADAEAKISTIDDKMKQNRDAMRYLQQDRVGTDPQGRQFVNPLPELYWEYDRANRRLEIQRRETITLMETLRSKAQAVKQQLPVPKFTGVQVAIGVEGTPAIAPTIAPDPKPGDLKANPPAAGNPLDRPGEAQPAASKSSDPAGNPLDPPKGESTPKKSDNRPLKY